MRIYWTDTAREDVREIRDYLRQHASEVVATQAIKESRVKLPHYGNGRTKDFPIQAPADLNINTYRELLAGPHRIIFERTSTAFTIHLVCHTSRDLEAMLQRRHLKP